MRKAVIVTIGLYVAGRWAARRGGFDLDVGDALGISATLRYAVREQDRSYRG